MKKIAKISQETTVLSQGKCTISFKIPGNFTTIKKDDPNYSGWQLDRAVFSFSSPSFGDKINSITLKDNDGLLPIPFRSIFPSYPILASGSIDSLDPMNQGAFIIPGLPVEYKMEGQSMLLPSGMYLEIQAQKSSAIVDTLYMNLFLDDRLG